MALEQRPRLTCVANSIAAKSSSAMHRGSMSIPAYHEASSP